MNEQTQLKWILYRLTAPQCCANCLNLRDNTCPKGNRSLRRLTASAKRWKCSVFNFGSRCECWR